MPQRSKKPNIEKPDLEERLARGRARPDARFTTRPSAADMPSAYGSLLNEIKGRVQRARLRTVLAANASMVLAYWDIGQVILARQEAAGWGAKIIDRLSADLREAFPDMQGLSPRNLKYMRAFAAAWPDESIVQRVVAQLPWKQNIALLDKLKQPEERLWYARKTLEHGWSQPILCLQIEGRLHHREGRAQSNFDLTLPPADSDLATQIFKDPYLFDFVVTADPRREREIEQMLVDHIQRFLLELGAGFAFVGRQVHLEVGSQDFYIDLLFYHLKLRRYVVVELKNRAFQAGDAGQMNLYLSAADDLLKHPDDQPTIGLLLCKGQDKMVVEYALRGLDKPIGVAGWTTQLLNRLPAELQSSLPTVKQIEAELALVSKAKKPAKKSRS
jgi:predicted nuclease of restriction endonuclease-like (RecB) superfamily